jgi:HAD superfamily hydrolase (TIGR01509 family)|tara:strand:- start:491 stop:1147 length:657 start_codon:yes stop_codon:yes gene_type:complete
MKNINGILFDMDGTILDSEDLWDKAQIQFLKENDIVATPNDFGDFKGLSYKHFYPLFIKKFNIQSSINDIRFKLRTYLYKIMETELKYIKGFEDFYKTHIKGTKLKVGLVTNTTRLSYQKIQTCINVNDYFDFVITANEAKEPKPSPIPYLQAMDFLSLHPNETIIIEDSKIGLISAINSKAKVIGITTSLTDEEITKIDKNILIANSYDDISIYFKN